MTNKELEQFIPKFRTGALSMKEFGKLPKKEKDQYILNILQIPKEQRGLPFRNKRSATFLFN